MSIRIVLTEKSPFKMFSISGGFNENDFYVVKKCISIEELLESHRLQLLMTPELVHFDLGFEEEVEQAIERDEIKEFISDYYIITEGDDKGCFVKSDFYKKRSEIDETDVFLPQYENDL